MTVFPRLRRLREMIRLDREFGALGWPRGRFLCSYYRGRLHDHTRRGKPPPVRCFPVRHGVDGREYWLNLRLDPGGGDWVVTQGVWIHQDYWFQGLKECRTILDLGANIGAAAVWFNALCPGAEFVCVEANPENVPLLRKNLERNSVRARVVECAVSTRQGTARFGIGIDHGISALEGSGFHADARYLRHVDVETRRVPDILDEAGWATVDLIKMDLEGLEAALLADMHDWCERVNAIVLEVHANTSPQALASLLEPLGWSLEALHDTGELTCLATPAVTCTKT